MIVEHKKHITVTNKSGVVKRHAQSTIKTISSMQTENFNEVQDSEIAQSYTFNQFTVTNNGYRGTNLAIYKPEKLGEDLPDWFFDGTQNLTMNQNQVQIEDPNFATTFTSNVGAFTSISFQYHDLQFPEIVTFYNAAGEAFQTQNLNVVGTSFESGPGTAQGIFSSGTLSQAAISFVVSGTGDAWNMDNLSFELAYTPPPTPPTPPAPPSPVALVINTSTGIIPSGGLTNNATPVISGTGIAGDTVTVTNGGKPVGSTTVAANGTWTLPVSTPLADGMQNISATQTDPVGNTSTPTTTSFTIDTIPDSPPTVTITSDANHDGIINIAELAGSANKINLQIGLPKDASAGDILTVTDQAGNTVTQALTAANIGAGHVVLNGNFNAPASGTTFTAKATLTDAAGNVSLPGSASDQIQNIAPSAPNVVISNPSASIANGGLTDNTSPSISGKGVAGDKVSITDEGKALGTVTVGANGTWTLPLTTPLTNGVQNISAIQIDPYGNSSTPTNTSFTVTTQSVAVTNITGTIVTPATTQTETFDEANYPYSGQIYGFNKFNVTSNGYCGTRLQMIQSGYLLNDSTQCLMINANQYQVASSNFATTFSSKVGSFSSISFQYNDLQIPAVITFYNAAGQAFESENLNAVGTSAFCGQGKGVFSSGALWQSATSFVISGTGDAWTMDNLIFTTPASSAAVSIASGSKTTATDPCLKGTISHALYSGEIVEVYRNGTDIGKATVNGTNWTYNDKIGSGSAAIYTAKVIENGAAVATSNSYSINAMVQAMAAIAPSSAAITSPSITTSSATTPVLAVMH